MDNKKITTGNSGIINGINKTVDTIKVTLGPKGRCVAIADGFDTPNITRDGATVAKAIKFNDPEEDMGAQIVKHAAKITEALAGDGTSTTSILLQELIRNGSKYLDDNVNLNEIKSGLEKAQSWVTEYIKDNSIEVGDDLEKIRKIATISANNDPKVGDYIVQAMEKVGVNGVITADLSGSLETFLETKDGFRVDRGWASPHFVNNAKNGTCVLQNPDILVCGERIATINQLVGVLKTLEDKTGKQGIQNPILIICDDIDDATLTWLAYNCNIGALSACVIKGVDFGDNRQNIMADIAVSVGAQYICSENGFSLSEPDHTFFGGASKAVIEKDSCVIYDGQGDKALISERLEILKDMIQAEGITDYEKNKLQRRIASLGGGVCVIRSGGASEMEKVNGKQTIEDAILASKSAISEGVVPGGGSLFVRAADAIKKNIKTLTGDEKIGAEILIFSLPIIMKTIASNAGKIGTEVIEQVKKSKTFGYGFNAKTGEFGNLMDMGILDSARVLRVSLENAVSAASMVLLTQKSIIPDVQESECHCCKNNDGCGIG